jgi:hypothetical protein
MEDLDMEDISAHAAQKGPMNEMMVAMSETAPPALTSLASGPSMAPIESSQEVDGWISILMQCKQLSEMNVKRLCEKVWAALRCEFVLIPRHERFYRKNRMYSMFHVPSLCAATSTASSMI